MCNIKIELSDWDEFKHRLPYELKKLGHTKNVAVRSFDLETCTLDDDYSILGSVDRLALALATGTDRDNSSPMWNVPGHDYEHNRMPTGKSPHEITYAYIAEMQSSSYLVHYADVPEAMDLTKGLSEHNGILIYDAEQLIRVSKNEHWFIGRPRNALLLVFTLKRLDYR